MNADPAPAGARPAPGLERLLLVNARDAEEARIALTEPSRLLALRWSRTDRESAVGNVYLATVRAVEPGLDAAFIDYGGARAGFLHLGNLHPGYADRDAEPFAVAGTATDAAYSPVEVADKSAPAERSLQVDQILHPGQPVLVQVLRDPVRGKGATLTTFISLAGRLLVLMPSLGRPGVSRRIADEVERERLREAVAALEVPAGMGVIARTAAADSTRRDLRRDLKHLLRLWASIQEKCSQQAAPCLLVKEDSAVVRAVRDLYSAGEPRVIVDEEATAREIESFFQRYSPRARVQVERYSGSQPLFEHYDLERDYQLLFRARVPVGDGASIVIHETEALTAIDVNSGRIDKGSLERTARRANLVAAEEIARQIGLRDIGGIIVVDFIDMGDASNRRELETAFRKALRRDRARLKPGRLGAFGLMPLTRRRMGTGLPKATEWECRACGGTGSTTQHQAGALRVLRRLRAAGGGGWHLRAHPGVIEALEQRHAAAMAALDLDLVTEADPQVPPGEPVLDGNPAER